MFIALRGEMDTRPLSYPLLRCLKDYGSICFITTNKQISRLIDGEYDSEFRNIRIIINESGATDEVLSHNGIAHDDYDFIICDNMGIVEYDVLIAALGVNHSISYLEEINLLKEENDKVHVIQFGKAQSLPKGADCVLEIPGLVEPNLEEVLEDKSSKYKSNKGRTTSKKDTGDKSKRVVSIPFPNYQEIEDLEGIHKFAKVQPQLVDAFYTIFKDTLLTDKRNFMKGVGRVDEGGSNIKYKTSR